MALKPITLWWRPLGPNPFKVLIVLEELGLPYKGQFIEEVKLKQPEYEALCINGRSPTIQDPNTGVVLWESIAIIDYLIDTYDKDKSLTYTSSPEKYQVQQWLHFQSSGQGPYFGQATWFLNWHKEKLPSAQERYLKEIHRVCRVLDRHLEGREWLIGDKYTIADLAFFPWDDLLHHCLVEVAGREYDMAAYPNMKRWHEAVRARPAVQRALVHRSADHDFASA